MDRVKQGKERQVPIATEWIRLDALLKLAGAAETGGEAKVLIQSGRVLVDGELCLQRGKKLCPGDMAALLEGETSFLVTDGRGEEPL